MEKAGFSVSAGGAKLDSPQAKTSRGNPDEGVSRQAFDILRPFWGDCRAQRGAGTERMGAMAWAAGHRGLPRREPSYHLERQEKHPLEDHAAGQRALHSHRVG